MEGIWMMFYVPGVDDIRAVKIVGLLHKKRRTRGWLASQLKKELQVNPPEVRRWLDLENGEPPKIEKYTSDPHVYDRMLKIIERDKGSGRRDVAPGVLTPFLVFATGSPKERKSCRLASTEEMDFPYDGDSEIYGQEIKDEFMVNVLNLGDIAIFEVAESAVSGEVVHLHRNGEDLIACRRVIDDVAWAFPFNREAKEFACTDWDVHGRCIGARRQGAMGTVHLILFTKGLKWSMRDLHT